MTSIPQTYPKVNNPQQIAARKRARKRGRERLRQIGLVNNAISSHDVGVVAELKLQAGGMVAKRTFYASPPKSNGRGVVSGMSQKSRKRLRELLINVNWSSIIPEHGKSNRGVVITLTYPNEFPTDWHDHKAHLKAFLMRLERRWSLAGVLWRLEHQRRGAAHYHLLVILKRDVDVQLLRAWTSMAWFQVVASGDERHLRAGTNVRRLHGPTGKLMRYLSKYVSKPDAGNGGQTGRTWGVWGELPVGETTTVLLDRQQWVLLCRRLRRWGKSSRYLKRITANHRGFLVFGSVSQLSQLLRGLGLGEEFA